MDNLFILNESEVLPIDSIEYEQETELQQIIAKNPGLASRCGENLLLVCSEWKTGGGGDSLDHLLLDTDDATLVLVEDKRSSDSRIRREVLAQMIDYASQVINWDIELIRSNFAENNPGRDIYDDAFWNLVKENMDDGHVRLAFIADSLPGRLREMIEYCQHSFVENIEVYGVEIKLHKICRNNNSSEELKLVSKQVIGFAKTSKKSGTKLLVDSWNLQETSEQVRAVLGNKSAELAEKIVTELTDIGYQIKYGTGEKQVRIAFNYDGKCLIHFEVGKNMAAVIPYTANMMKMLDNGSTNEDLQKLFLDLPVRNAEYERECQKNKGTVSIRLQQLYDADNLNYTINNFKTIYEMIDAENG